MPLVCVGLVLAAGGGSVAMYEAFASFDPQEALAEIQETSPETWSGIRDALPELVAEGGIAGAFAVNRLAFTSEDIGIFHCHLINHLIGHVAVAQHGDDFNALFAYADWQFCELGYLHGAEAQIALEDGAYDGRLHALCEKLLSMDAPVGGCYHGVGHAYMNETLDVETALARCDELRDGPADSVHECYEGTFAELTNLVGGIDGETGIPYAGGPPISIDQRPLVYCADLDPEYQAACAYELNGLGIGLKTTPEQTAQRLDECVSYDYPQGLEQACLYSVAAVSAQHEVAAKGTVTLAPNMLDLPQPLRHAYIEGAAREIGEFFKSGVEKDWRAFCDNFSREADWELCAQTVAEGFSS